MSKAWDLYNERMALSGPTKRDMWKKRAMRSISNRIRHSLSYHEVIMGGLAAQVAITHGVEASEKKIFSMPGEHLVHGGLVEFADNVWLIVEVDADNEVYEKGRMLQCNHILRWIATDGTLKEKWCVVEDGTKYLIGEKSTQLMTIGDARIALTIGKDEDTIELKRGYRFLVDDVDTDYPLAYQITKSNKLFNVYNEEGVFRFILNEVEMIDEDDVNGKIAGATDWRLNLGLDGGNTDGALTTEEIHEALNITEEVPPHQNNKEVWL